MADVSTKYNCGCGFKTESLKEATEHSDARRHTLSVLGEIQPAKRDAATNPRKVPAVGVPTPDFSEKHNSFDDLRRRIKKS